MNASNKKPGDIIQKIELSSLLKSAGISMAQIALDIVATDNYYGHEWQVEVGQRLATLSELMYMAYTRYYELLSVLDLELPDSIVGVVVVNSLYNPDTTNPLYDDDGNVVVLGDDIPF
jgi:hypothetical protein